MAKGNFRCLQSRKEMRMHKPNILLFEASGSYYFYDVNKNTIVQISKEIYEYIPHRDYKNKNYEEIVGNLENAGFLSDRVVKKIQHPLTEYVDDYVEHNLNAMILQVTQNCNMRCRYCAFSGDGTSNRKHSNINMSEEIAIDAIDFFRKHSEYSDRASISFYGGEPLIMYGLVKMCIDYCKEVMPDKRMEYRMTTNGTVISDEIVEFLARENVLLTVSIDGPKKIHDKYRRFAIDGSGTFDRVYRNLSHIKEKYPDFYKTISINAVVDRDIEITEVTGFFSKDDLFKGINVDINGVEDSYIDMQYVETIDYKVSLEELLFKQLIDRMRGKKEQPGTRLLNSVKGFARFMERKELLPESMHHQGPCVPGQGKLFVDVQGNLRPCEKVSEHNQDLIIGNIYEGFDHDKIKRLLNIGLLTEEECKKCWAIRLCKECPLVTDNINGISREKKLIECEAQKRLIKELLKDYAILRKTQIM